MIHLRKAKNILISWNTLDSSVTTEEGTVNPRRHLRNRRNLKMPSKYADYVVDDGESENVALVGEVGVISASKALKDKNWLKAIAEVCDSHLKMKNWDFVKKPDNTKPLTCR